MTSDTFLDTYSDGDFKRTIWGALRLMGFALAVGTPVVWWKLGWQSAVLLLVGAAISGSGLFEWLRLMSAIMVRMDVPAPETTEAEAELPADKPTGKIKPIGPVLFGFFLRLGLTVVVLYGSLKLFDGSVYALAAGLALGVFALSVEGLRMMKAWTI